MSNIIVNGERLNWLTLHIAYSDIESMSDELEPTVVVRFNDKTYRPLERGEFVKVEDDMEITAVNTGRA